MQSFEQAITLNIVSWHTKIDRNLPWKKSKDPYLIWVSEIILQQTRVTNGIPYYEKFIKRFSTIEELAYASLDELMLIWQGLGYYNRAKNMHYTANEIVEKYNGNFPTNYDDILALKGIGPYTAAAIISFAFDQQYPVVDANVIRVISRVYAIKGDVQKRATIDEIYRLSKKLIIYANPSNYNQAVMDFGALICSTRPKCNYCPIQRRCKAYTKNLTGKIPYKNKIINLTRRFFHYFIIRDANNLVLIKKRIEKDIWYGLHDFPLIEKKSNEIIPIEKIELYISKFFENQDIVIDKISNTIKHILTHQIIYTRFYSIRVQDTFLCKSKSKVINFENLDKYAMPVMITRFLENKTT